MASGQEIVDRILKSYNVEFDSNVSGKLNEFMIRYTIDILKLAKNLSIFEKKETFSLIEIRQAIKQMKENKGISFDEMQNVMKEMQVQNLGDNINNVPIYDQIFPYDERILIKSSLKQKASQEERDTIQKKKEEDRNMAIELMKVIELERFLKPQARKENIRNQSQQLQQDKTQLQPSIFNPQPGTQQQPATIAPTVYKPPVEEDDDYE